MIDERIGEAILKNAFQSAYPKYETAILPFLKTDLKDYARRRVLREHLPDFLQGVSKNAISHLKNRRIDAPRFRERLPAEAPVLVRLVADVFERYSHALHTRGALDFDDLITSALRVLEQDNTLVDRLQARWPFILEDEAQDSSALQEQILSNARRSAG